MKTRHNLDELFQEKLLRAEVKPPMDAWNNISTRLPEKKKKKRFIAFWYKMSGVAAVFVIGAVLTLNFFEKAAPAPAPQVTQQDLKTETEQLFDAFQEQMLRSTLLLSELSNKKFPPTRAHIPETTNESDPIEKEKQKEKEIPLIQVQSASDIAVATVPQLKFSSENDAVENEKKEQQMPIRRLSVSTKFAPLFTPAGESEPSFSYGFQIAYRVSPHVLLRTGLNSLHLNRQSPQPVYGVATAGAATLASPEPATVAQESDFLEVPLEIEYSVLDKKLALDLIGGGSLLYLRKNDISLNAPGFALPLAPAGQTETTGFTANFGLGLGYQVVQQLQLRIEPMVKFQLLSGTAAQESHYFGIYSGLNYSF